MVVLEVAAQDATQVLLVEHDHVVQAVSPNGTNQPFDVCILPGRPRGGQHFFDAKVAYTLLKVLAIDSIPVSEKVAWRSLFREGLHDLLRRPRCAGAGRDIEMQNAPPVMREDEQDNQYSECGSGDDEEVERYQARDVVVQEGPPIGQRRLSVPQGQILNGQILLGLEERQSGSDETYEHGEHRLSMSTPA